MIGIGDSLPKFKLAGVKPGFNDPEEKGISAFEEINNDSFRGKWKIIYFYPKDFTFICPTEIIEFSSINDEVESSNGESCTGIKNFPFLNTKSFARYFTLDSKAALQTPITL